MKGWVRSEQRFFIRTMVKGDLLKRMRVELDCEVFGSTEKKEDVRWTKVW